MVSFIGLDTWHELGIGFYLKIRDTTFIITDLKSMNIWKILQCITILNGCNNIKKNICLKMPCHKKHKMFFYYCRMSIKEGLNTELSDSDLTVGKYDKDLFQECNFCYRVFEIKKAFKENEYICNQCFKLLQKVKDEKP